MLNEFVGDNDINNKSKLINCDNSINTISQTISNYNTNESSSQNSPQEEIDIKLKKCIFKSSKKSRFSFVNSDNLENIEQKPNFIVPDYIKEILKKKFYSLSFSNSFKINKNENIDHNFLEKILLDEEIKIVNKWALTN